MNLTKSNERMTELDDLIPALEIEVKTKSSTLDKMRNERKELKAAIHEMMQPPKVSDHAIIRYLERVKGVDIEAIRAEILTPKRMGAIKAGVDAINVDGISFKVKGTTIVTTV